MFNLIRNDYFKISLAIYGSSSFFIPIFIRATITKYDKLETSFKTTEFYCLTVLEAKS